MTYETNYLAHHGIKGQKWGVRRFQNRDGTLTSAGKQRYDAGEARAGTSTASSRVSNSSTSTSSKSGSRKETAKKVAIGLGVTATVATAALVYSKHHEEINASIAKSLKSMPTPKQLSKEAIGKGKSAIDAYDKAVYNAGKKVLHAPQAVTKLASAYGPNATTASKKIASAGLKAVGKKGKAYVDLASNTVKKTVDSTINSAIQGVATAATLGVMYKVASKDVVDKYYNDSNNKSKSNGNRNRQQNNARYESREQQSNQLKDIQQKHSGKQVKISLSKKGNKIARVYDPHTGREIANYNLGKA